MISWGNLERPATNSKWSIKLEKGEKRKGKSDKKYTGFLLLEKREVYDTA